MKILHTSDWHIGRTLYGRKRYEEFEAFLTWLAETIQQNEIDALLVAGDVFDTSAPSNRAQELYYRFLCRVAASSCRHIVVVAGNHDSPSFLNAPKELLKALDVHVVGSRTASPEDEVLVLCNEQDAPELIVCAVPYLRALFDAAKAVCAARNVTALDGFQANSLPIVILGFLDDFAHPGGRYSNINKLIGHRHQAMADPIARWGEIASQIMQTQATSRERERAQMNGRMASIAFGDAAASLMSDLDQRHMDVAPLHVRASELDTAAKYAIYALVILIAALRDVIDSLCDSAWAVNRAARAGAAEVPAMKEFLQFAWADRQYVMRKRQWP